MKITQAILDELTAKAKASERLRMNLDLRNSAEDQSQRMLNAIEPGSPLPIHRHQKTSETMACLRGKLRVEYYEVVQGEGSNMGSRLMVHGVQEPTAELIEKIELCPNGPVVAVSIPIGVWHTVHALESGTVILEMKNGSYEPLSDEDILKM